MRADLGIHRGGKTGIARDVIDDVLDRLVVPVPILFLLELRAAQVFRLAGDRHAVGKAFRSGLGHDKLAERLGRSIADLDLDLGAGARDGEKSDLRAVVQLHVERIGLDTLLVRHAHGNQAFVECAGHRLAVDRDLDFGMHRDLPIRRA